MKYSKPEIEIVDFSQTEAVCTDPISASGETIDPTPNGSGTPIIPLSADSYWNK